MIWIADHIKVLPHIMKEITLFPKFKFKDWLDTLADQMQGKDGKIDLRTVIPQPRLPSEDPTQSRFAGFGPDGQPRWDDDDSDHEQIYGGAGQDNHNRDSMTGVI
jgi:hypothetical protein